MSVTSHKGFVGLLIGLLIVLSTSVSFAQRLAPKNPTSRPIDRFVLPGSNLTSQCSIHFSSGEHPLYVRCPINSACTGVGIEDAALSVSWNVWNGGTASCVSLVTLSQLPLNPYDCAEEIVDDFNATPGCIQDGLAAFVNGTIVNPVIDIYYIPQPGEQAIPGAGSFGTISY